GVTIRFDEEVADYIREKKWHASQKLRELPRGGVELDLTLSSLIEIERWILSWGGHAKVIRPPELIASVRAAGRKIAAGGAKLIFLFPKSGPEIMSSQIDPFDHASIA